MSAQIQEAIAPLRAKGIAEYEDNERGPKAVFTGKRPDLSYCSTAKTAGTTGDLVRRIHSEIGAPYGSIAIVLRTNPKDNDPILQKLDESGVPFTVYGTGNRNLELDADKVHLITAHSIKGLEFPHIIIPRLSSRTFPASNIVATVRSESEREEVLSSERRLLYVACSRAMHTLWLISDKNNPSPFLEDLDLSLWDTNQIQD